MSSVIITLSVALALLAIVAGMFFIMYKQNKAEKAALTEKYNAEKERAETATNSNAALINSNDAYGDAINEYQEELNQAINGNKLSNANACDAILSN